MENKLKLFQGKSIRSAWNEEEQQWYFSILDVVQVLTRDEMLNLNWGTICTPVQMTAEDGKRRKIQAANIKGLFHIIQLFLLPKQSFLNCDQPRLAMIVYKKLRPQN